MSLTMFSVGRDTQLVVIGTTGRIDLIPTLSDNHSCAHWRSPIDMIVQG